MPDMRMVTSKCPQLNRNCHPFECKAIVRGVANALMNGWSREIQAVLRCGAPSYGNRRVFFWSALQSLHNCLGDVRY